MGREGDTKEARKERKRLKKLAKEAKKSKKRKLEEVDQDSDEKVESPKSKKRKLTSDSEGNGTVNVGKFKDITKVIVGASKEQLQNALLQCAKQTPTDIPAMETNLEAAELDPDLNTLLESERETAAENAPSDPTEESSSGKMTGIMQKWDHEKGFGFVTRDDGKGDLFCHRNDCLFTPPHASVKTGSKVEFTVEKDAEKGDRAANVTGIGGEGCEGGRQCKGVCTGWMDDKEVGYILDLATGQKHMVFGRDCWTESGKLESNDKVEFDIKVKDSGKTCATFVTLEGQSISGYGGGSGGGGGADMSTMEFPEEEAWVDQAPTPGKSVGTIIKWAHERGFGFVQMEDGNELFVHARELMTDGSRNARVGSKVEFDVENGEKGAAAVNVQRLGGGAVRGGRQAVGVCAAWMHDRGFGFVEDRHGGRHIVFDKECYTTAGTLEAGDKVEFDIKVKQDGRTQATYVAIYQQTVQKSAGLASPSEVIPAVNLVVAVEAAVVAAAVMI